MINTTIPFHGDTDDYYSAISDNNIIRPNAVYPHAYFLESLQVHLNKTLGVQINECNSMGMLNPINSATIISPQPLGYPSNTNLINVTGLKTQFSTNVNCTNNDNHGVRAINDNSSIDLHNNSNNLTEISDAQQKRFDTNSACKVCGDFAYGKHYGINTCNGCKGFFRRSICSKRFYNCRFGGNCNVTKEQRNACRFCRLKRCIQAGMNPNSVQQENDQNDQSNDEYDRLLLNCKNNIQKSEPLKMKSKLCQTEISRLSWNTNSSSSVCSSLSPSSTITQHYLNNNNGIQLEMFKSEVTDSPKIFESFTTPSSSASQSVEAEYTDWAKLLEIERETMDLRDENCVSTETNVPIKKIEFSFEIAFQNPQLVSSRFPINFNPNKLMTGKLFVDGWRRYFVYYIDWTKRIDDFMTLFYEDRLILAKQRFAPIGWLFHAYHNLSVQNPAILCMASGSYHVITSDVSNESGKGDMKFCNERMYGLIQQVFEKFRELNLDGTEFAIFKASLLFHEELGISERGLQQICKAREKYFKMLFHYIFEKKQRNSDCNKTTIETGCSTSETSEPPTERVLSILLTCSLLSTISGVMAERIELNDIFNIIELDTLIRDTHLSDNLSMSRWDKKNLPIT